MVAKKRPFEQKLGKNEVDKGNEEVLEKNKNETFESMMARMKAAKGE